MRIDDPSPRPNRGRLRLWVEPLRLRFSAWGPGVRRGIGAAALVVVACVVGFLSKTGEESDTTAWIDDGRRFAADEADAIARVLKQNNLRPRRDPQGRIGVPADKETEALVLLDKKDLLPGSLKTLRDRAVESSWVESPSVRQAKLARADEQELELILKGFDGVASADVMIRREPIRRGATSPTVSKALVILHAEEARPISLAAVMSTQTLITSRFPDLEPEALTILDAKGHALLIGGNAEAGVQSQAHARADELRDAILERLRWIEGVSVFVTLDPDPPATPEPAATELKANSPIDDTPQLVPLPGPRPLGKADVMVQVPRRYYLNVFRSLNADREPSREDLAEVERKTDAAIRAAAVNVVTADGLGDLNVVRFDAPASPQPAAPTGGAVWDLRGRSAWLIAGAGGSVAMIVAIVGGRWLLVRRPSARPAMPIRRPHVESTDAPGPLERARDLVRRDPEAAAGVLRRWIVSEGGES